MNYPVRPTTQKQNCPVRPTFGKIVLVNRRPIGPIRVYILQTPMNSLQCSLQILANDRFQAKNDLKTVLNNLKYFQFLQHYFLGTYFFQCALRVFCPYITRKIYLNLFENTLILTSGRKYSQAIQALR